MTLGFPEDQSLNNIAQAERVMELVPGVDFTEVKDALRSGRFRVALVILDEMNLPNPGGLVPDPQIVIRAEIVNAERYWKINLSC